jgi:WD40 repeat protein
VVVALPLEGSSRLAQMCDTAEIEEQIRESARYSQKYEADWPAEAFDLEAEALSSATVVDAPPTLRVLYRSVHESSPVSVSISPDGEHIATACEDGSVKLLSASLILDVASKKSDEQNPKLPGCQCELESNDTLVDMNWISTASDKPSILASLSSKGSIFLHTPEQVDALWSFNLKGSSSANGDDSSSSSFSSHGRWNVIASHPMGDILACGGTDVALLDLHTQKRLSLPPIPWTSLTSSVSFSPDGRLLALGSNVGDVGLWEVASGALVGVWWGLGGGCDVKGTAFSMGSRTLSMTAHGKGLKIVDLASCSVVRTFRMEAATTPAWTKGSAALLCGSVSGELSVWLPRSGSQSAALKEHGKTPIIDICTSENVPLVASCGADKKTNIWSSAVEMA